MKRLMCFVILVFVCEYVVAVSGVLPGSYSISFEPNYSGKFVFDFVLEGDADLYVEGDLAKYVELDKERIFGREKVVAVLNLPSVIGNPGVNQIFVGARGEGVNVRGVIKIIVPYPEKYVGLELSASNANVGKVVDISLKMLNFGNQTVDVRPMIKIYRGEKMIDVFYGDVELLNVSEFLNFNIFLDSSDYSAGDYVAVAVVNYGDKVATIDNVFRLGDFVVRIFNYTDEFVEGEINKFEVGIESLWDSRIKEVYAEIRVAGSDVGFDSSIVKLEGWEKKILVGAFDGSGFSVGDVDAEIILHYDGGVVSKKITLKIIKNTDYVFYFCVTGFLAFIFALVWFLFFRKRKVNG